MRLDQALESFLVAKESANRSADTLDFYRRNVQVFIAWLERQIAAGKIDGADWCQPATIERFLAHERRRNLSPYTVHARYRSLRALFGWLESRHGIPSPVSAVEEPERPDKAPRQVELEAVERLVDSIPAGDGATWADLRDRLVLLLFFWTGLRLSELAALHVPDVDVKRRLIYVQRGKGHKARYVPIPSGTPALLLEYLMARPPWSGPELFLGNDGAGGVRGAIQAGGIRTMIRRRCQAAGVEYRNPHAFRHGFAMTMLNSGGMEMGVLSKLLGHSSTQITQKIYADWVTESLRREYDVAQRKARTRDT